MRFDVRWLGLIAVFLLFVASFYGFYFTFSEAKYDTTTETYTKFFFSLIVLILTLLGLTGAILSLINYYIIGGLIQLVIGLVGVIFILMKADIALNVGLDLRDPVGTLVYIGQFILSISGILSLTASERYE
ncbi:MAG TPA: hypothetical protein VH186_33540 [Chloroflexia bacterium]|nr:hypothetical protein [Chloroflexia bacterium]